MVININVVNNNVDAKNNSRNFDQYSATNRFANFLDRNPHCRKIQLFFAPNSELQFVKPKPISVFQQQ